ncbi:MAG: substrate-binding domain-containing protein [Planctomycetota bacterium]|nr:substrate-binding domain-containing protein [Planctomycetota bacterium]
MKTGASNERVGGAAAIGRNRLSIPRFALLALLVSTLVVVAACDNAQPPAKVTPGETPVPKTAETIILATTTSVNDTGLLDVLLAEFTKKTGIQVKPIAVGSGEAMKMGERGDADLLLVHSPRAEQELIDKGFGLNRTPFMRNYFLVAGPADDPAKIAEATEAREAFKKIVDAKAMFVSRSDNSGTHKKELELWKAAGLEPKGAEWYIEAGTGMAETLRIANEKDGYVLADSATYASQKDKLQLAVLYKGAKALDNIYSVLRLNPAKFPKMKTAASSKLADYILSDEGRMIIADFGKDKYGEPLFMLLEN